MSEQTHRNIDTSTPTVEDAALYWQWGGHMWQAPERFDQMIAKVKADALREFADGLMADAELDASLSREGGDWMRVRAAEMAIEMLSGHRIEEEP